VCPDLRGTLMHHVRGHDEKRHPHAHASHQGQLFCLKQLPGVIFKELKCYEKRNFTLSMEMSFLSHAL